LKTTVIALNEKVETINDIKQDIQDTRAEWTKSEEARSTLQVKITTTSQTVKKDCEEHKTY
jgi:peptidoglycan hydrolase CwlO-like protein